MLIKVVKKPISNVYKAVQRDFVGINFKSKEFCWETKYLPPTPQIQNKNCSGFIEGGLRMIGKGHEWCLMPVVLAMGSLGQEDPEIKASLDYTVRTCVKTNKQTNKHWQKRIMEIMNNDISSSIFIHLTTLTWILFNGNIPQVTAFFFFLSCISLFFTFRKKEC
jgi:hypothetical protein